MMRVRTDVTFAATIFVNDTMPTTGPPAFNAERFEKQPSGALLILDIRPERRRTPPGLLSLAHRSSCSACESATLIPSEIPTPCAHQFTEPSGGRRGSHM